jgi:hypothetical protein
MPVTIADKEVPTAVAVGAAIAAPFVLRAGYKMLKGAPKVVQNGKYKGVPLPADVYDAVIVGAGPSGSTCAYFFAKVCVLRGGGARFRGLDAKPWWQRAEGRRPCVRPGSGRRPPGSCRGGAAGAVSLRRAARARRAARGGASRRWARGARAAAFFARVLPPGGAARAPQRLTRSGADARHARSPAARWRCWRRRPSRATSTAVRAAARRMPRAWRSFVSPPARHPLACHSPRPRAARDAPLPRRTPRRRCARRRREPRTPHARWPSLRTPRRSLTHRRFSPPPLHCPLAHHPPTPQAMPSARPPSAS